MESLIVVCDKKTEEYGRIFLELLNMGEAARNLSAKLWTEKEYKANKEKNTPDVHIIFIGENKISRDIISRIPTLYEKFGMCYGWADFCGKLTVDKGELSLKDYSGFMSFCRNYRADFEKNIGETGIYGEEAAKMLAGLLEERKKEGCDDVIKNNPNIALALMPATGALPMCTRVGMEGDMSKKQTEVRDRQYRALMAVFYIEGLLKFLGC